jgi:hypothetical protein
MDPAAILTHPRDLDPRLWSEAYERVENLLLAHRVTNRFQLARLSRVILESAAARHALHPGQDPGEIAAAEAQHLIARWIDELVGESDESPTVRHARGRAAMLLAELPQRWPESFLNTQAAPPELLAELRATYVQAGPDLEFSNMAPRPIELGPISNVADQTWKSFARWPALQGIVLWTLFLGLLGTVFFLTRIGP